MSSGQGEEAESRSIPGVQQLRARLSELETERDEFFSQLGAAALDGDDRRVKLLEGQLDALDARRAGLAAEIAQLEANAAMAERERRRQEAVEREQARRDLFGTQLELYDDWSANLEHGARVAEAIQELERLKSARPFDPAGLDTIAERLLAAGVKIDTTYREVQASDDPHQLREVARRYQTLARFIRQQPRKGSAEGQTQAGAAMAEPSEGQPTAEAPPVETHQPAAAASEQPPPLVPPERASESREPVTAQRQTSDAGESISTPGQANGAREPAAPRSEGGAAESRGMLRLLEEEERRLRNWRDSLERQGDPLGILGEVNRQLDEIVAKRTTLLRLAGGV